MRVVSGGPPVLGADIQPHSGRQGGERGKMLDDLGESGHSAYPVEVSDHPSGLGGRHGDHKDGHDPL